MSERESARIWSPAAEQLLRGKAQELRAAADAIDMLLQGARGEVPEVVRPLLAHHAERRRREMYAELAALIRPAHLSWRAWAAAIFAEVERYRASPRPPTGPESRLAKSIVDTGLSPLSANSLRLRLLPRYFDDPEKYWARREMDAAELEPSTNSPQV